MYPQAIFLLSSHYIRITTLMNAFCNLSTVIIILQHFFGFQSKRDTLMVHIKWFYRPCEVPETVYQLLIQDRTALDSQDTKSSLDIPNGKFLSKIRISINLRTRGRFNEC